MNEYDKQADDFLKATGTTFAAEYFKYNALSELYTSEELEMLAEIN